MIATALKHMLAAGMDHDAIVAAVADMEASAPKDTQAERRRQADRERKRLRKSAESADTVSPKKETSPTPPKEKTTPSSFSEARASSNGTPAGFSEFWEIFPNKVGKRDAEKAFTKALQRSDLQSILAGTRRYASKSDDRPWCNPATFLNQDRWGDQPAPVPQRQATAPPQRDRSVSDVLREISSGTYTGPPNDDRHPTIDTSFSRRN